MTVAERPGGRSARVRAQVHAATWDLLSGERWARTSLGGIADRAGVQASTLYRRWETLPRLLGDVLDARLGDGSPLPDTGTLEGDLHRWAAGIAADLDGPDGAALLRAALLLSSGASPTALPSDTLSGRTGQIEELRRRAEERGEHPPPVRDIVEIVISPLYGYALFGRGALTRRAPALVDRLLGAAH